MAAELGLGTVAEQRGGQARAARSAGRSRGRGRAAPARRRPTSRRRSKKPRLRGRRGAGPPSRRGDRDRSHRRAPRRSRPIARRHRAQADPPPGLGAARRTPHGRRTPPLATWLTVTAFVSPATGESYRSPFHRRLPARDFEDVLTLFAREAGAGRDRIILLVLDNAGWHSAPGLAVPEGIRLVHLPPYTPELQPAETLWVHVDEPLANRHFDTLGLTRCRRRPPVRRPPRRPRPRQGPGRVPLVAQSRRPELIRRKSYDGLRMPDECLEPCQGHAPGPPRSAPAVEAGAFSLSPYSVAASSVSASLSMVPSSSIVPSPSMAASPSISASPSTT